MSDSDGQTDGLVYLTVQYQNGKYQGNYKSGAKNGYGKFNYQNGGLYQGNWLNDQQHGQGKLYYDNGQIAYEGQWFEGQFHGTGKVYNDQAKNIQASISCQDLTNFQQYWVTYQGGLHKDQKSGHGKISLSNSQWFQGEFQNDKANGQGIYFKLSGQIIQGVWEDSILIQKL